MIQLPTLLRAILIAGATLSMAGCSGILSGDPFEEEVTAADGKPESLSYSLSRKLVTGLGGTSSDTRKIEYKPRGPLTVPPAMELREPEEGGAQAANWPTQGDGSEAYLAELEQGKTHRERTRDDWENPVVPGREMARYRVIGGGNVANPEDNDGSDEATRMSADQARQVSEQMRAQKTAEADGSRQRRYLTEPPVVYRQPAGGAELPSNVKLEKKKGKFDDWEKPAGF